MRYVFWRRHSAYVEDPFELAMGSPQYGRLILDRKPPDHLGSVEYRSLLWSDGRRLLAAQLFENGGDDLFTSVVVIDADARAPIARSPTHRGICNPLRFEDDALVYELWHYRDGERELRLPLPN